jgi:thiamine biosynthesis lipoprotein ApbE
LTSPFTPLIKLWKTAQKTQCLANPSGIQEAQKHMGMDRIKLLNKNQVQLLTPAPSLTIDSIADGYAADETARILRAYGFTNFLVDATGELYGRRTQLRRKILEHRCSRPTKSRSNYRYHSD